ncbi:hypothetical protein [Yoonia sp.]|uniref:hypothetical protein n=1 Tax=Yoonia sp. TaxID=2212373 RepID=UPI0025CDF770|nr:hypothetical protein [Yoonia sp.]
MQIAFHIGANCTDEDRLLKSILKNASVLLQQGIAVPGPGKYRSLIRETIQALDGAPPEPDTRDILIDAIVENDNLTRLVMSNDNFICVPNRIFGNGVFYEQAGPKTRALHRLFSGDDIELFLGIRNPATFLQDAFIRSKAASISEYLRLMHPEDIQWSDVVRRIKGAAPDTPLTVWCNEDTPLLWEQLIRQMSNVSPQTEIVGGLDMLSTLISDSGMRRLREQLRQNPPQTEAARNDVIADIWEQHALEDQVEDVIELAELDPALIMEMTENYEDDIAQITAMEGVTLLMPRS